MDMTSSIQRTYCVFKERTYAFIKDIFDNKLKILLSAITIFCLIMYMPFFITENSSAVHLALSATVAGVSLAASAFFMYDIIKQAGSYTTKLIFTIVYLAYHVPMISADIPLPYVVNTLLLTCVSFAVFYIIKNQKPLVILPLVCLLSQLADPRSVLLLSVVIFFYAVVCTEELSQKKKLTLFGLISFAAMSAAECIMLFFGHPPFAFDIRDLLKIASKVMIDNNYFSFSRLTFIFLLSSPFILSRRSSFRSKAAFLLMSLIMFVPAMIFSAFYDWYMPTACFCMMIFFSLYEKKFFSLNSKKTKIYLAASVAFALLCLFITERSDFELTQFYVNYQHFGFIQRGLFGTLMQLILGDRFNADSLSITVTVFQVIFISAVTVMLMLFVKKAKNGKEKYIVFFLMLIFLVGPSNTRKALENINIFLTLVSMYLLYKNKNTAWLTLPLTVICMLFHQVYAAIIFPMLFIAMVYRAFIDSDSHTLRNTSILVTTTLSVCILFFYMTFFNAASIDISYDEFYRILSTRSFNTLAINTNLINYVWLDHAHDHYRMIPNTITVSQKKNALIAFVVNLPLLMIYVYAFVKSIKSEKSRFKKFAYVTAMLSVLAILAPFITDTDYGRWFSQYIMHITVSTAFLSVIQPKDKKWYKDIPNKRLRKTALVLTVLAFLQYPFDVAIYTYYLKIF